MTHSHTIYSILQKQKKGQPVTLKHTPHRREGYTEQEKQLVVDLQEQHNEWTYKKICSEFQHSTGSNKTLSNDTIHRILQKADYTTNILTKVSVARNKPENIEARKKYSEDAITWNRSTHRIPNIQIQIQSKSKAKGNQT